MLNCEIISADSRQLYKELEIGTAKPSLNELASVKHHFINHISIEEEYNVWIYLKEVLMVLDITFKTHEFAILVGGTGLYLKAVMEGLDEIPDIPQEVVDHVTLEVTQKGLKDLVDELRILDPEYSQNADLENPYRVIRAVSILRHTGEKFSSFRTNSKKDRPFEIYPFLVEVDRSILYDKINNRVEKMIKQGLENEARNLINKKHLKSLHTVGYQEWFDFFSGDITKDKAIELIKRNSRRYAKRQGTWFRKYGEWIVLPESGKIDFILKNLTSDPRAETQ